MAALLVLPSLSSVSPSLPSSSSSSLASASPHSSVLLPPPPVAANRFQNVLQRSLILQPGSSCGLGITTPCALSRKRKVAAHASSEIDGTNSTNLDASKEGIEDSVSIENLPLESKLQLKLEQKLRMKMAKKIRLRRKRLVRKRRMRKKGRWPPSKMRKNKNV